MFKCFASCSNRRAHTINNTQSFVLILHSFRLLISPSSFYLFLLELCIFAWVMRYAYTTKTQTCTFFRRLHAIIKLGIFAHWHQHKKWKQNQWWRDEWIVFSSPSAHTKRIINEILSHTSRNNVFYSLLKIATSAKWHEQCAVAAAKHLFIKSFTKDKSFR